MRDIEFPDLQNEDEEETEEHQRQNLRIVGIKRNLEEAAQGGRPNQMEKDAMRDRDREEEVSEGKGSEKVKIISEIGMSKEDL